MIVAVDNVVNCVSKLLSKTLLQLFMLWSSFFFYLFVLGELGTFFDTLQNNLTAFQILHGSSAIFVGFIVIALGIVCLNAIILKIIKKPNFIFNVNSAVVLLAWGYSISLESWRMLKKTGIIQDTFKFNTSEKTLLVAGVLLCMLIVCYYLKPLQGVRQVLPILFIPILLIIPGSIGLVIWGYMGSPTIVINAVRSQGDLHSNKHTNIIFITIDALRAKNMSLYGYERQTTPNLDQFAQNAFVFDEVYPNGVKTVTSLASLFTSQYPFEHGVSWGKFQSAKYRENNLIYQLDSVGYKAVSVGMPLEFIGLNKDIHYQLVGETVDNTGIIQKLIKKYTLLLNKMAITDVGLYTLPGDRIGRLLDFTYFKPFLNGLIAKPHAMGQFDLAIKAMDDMKQEPYFMYVHLFDTHPEPLEPSPKYKGIYSLQKQFSADKYFFGESIPPAILPTVEATYDECVLEADAGFGDFIRQIKEMGIYDKSLIIVTADHGLYTKGQGRNFSNSDLSEMRIPLLIKLPFQDSGARLHVGVQHVDMAPTILSIIGEEIPQYMRGKSLLKYMNGAEISNTSEKMYLTLIESYQGETFTGKILVKDGDTVEAKGFKSSMVECECLPIKAD